MIVLTGFLFLFLALFGVYIVYPLDRLFPSHGRDITFVLIVCAGIIFITLCARAFS